MNRIMNLAVPAGIALALGALTGYLLLPDKAQGLPSNWEQTAPPVDWRALRPHSDPAIAEEINVRLNVAMDLVEGSENSTGADRIGILYETAVDDGNDEQLRRWTLYAIARVLDEADLTDGERGRLAQTYLDIIWQTHTTSEPVLRFSTRARIIQNGLYVYDEFAEAIEAVEEDPQVLAYLLDKGIEPGWWTRPTDDSRDERAPKVENPKTKLVPLAPTAEKEPVLWRYTTEEPDDSEWFAPAFDDSSWHESEAPFGVKDTPGANVRTEWSSSSIWLRRTVEIDDATGDIVVRVLHNDDALIYINGVIACDLRGFNRDYEQHHMAQIARDTLVSGETVIAVRCRNVRGPQAIDVGIVRVEPAAASDGR